jgi:hypothetical protein
MVVSVFLPDFPNRVPSHFVTLPVSISGINCIGLLLILNIGTVYSECCLYNQNDCCLSRSTHARLFQSSNRHDQALRFDFGGSFGNVHVFAVLSLKIRRNTGRVRVSLFNTIQALPGKSGASRN